MDLLKPFRALFQEDAPSKPIQDEGIKRVELHLTPDGASGTSIHGGFFDEEYLTELLDTCGPDQFDKMRRQDARIKMVLSSVKNPIRSAKWEIQRGGDEQIDEQMAELIEHILFEGMNKTWTSFVTEALSMVDFGHSVFEVVHKVVKNSQEFGDYVGINSLAFRSQRTLSRWNLDKLGNIETVQQLASGDVGDFVEIPGKNLLVFTIDKEGDNWQGISMLRPAYGPWLRKQTFLKLNSIGIEKYAVPTPIGTTPEGTANSAANKQFNDVIQKYVTHQSNSIVLPKGWEIDLKPSQYDPSKTLEAIKFENNEIVVSFMANFLELGQSGSGSYALSTDLSDFFLSGIEYIANQICEGINGRIIPELIRANFGPQENMPKLTHSGITDRAGKEFAEVVKMLTDSGSIIADDELEKHLRHRYALPEKSEEGQRETKAMPNVQVGQFSDQVTLAEKTARGLITDRSKKLREAMSTELEKAGKNLVNSVMRKYSRGSSKVEKFRATSNVKAKGKATYQAALKAALTEIAFDALGQARKEVPGGSKIKLADLDVKHFNQLPKETQELITSQSKLFAETQFNDLEKATFFQFDSSFSSTDDPAILKADLDEAVTKFSNSPSVIAGAGNVTSGIVNETRNAFFFTEDVIKDVNSFTFTNPDPKSEICKNLRGKTFRSDDPEAGRFYPPLHHNCKSYLVPNFNEKKLTPGGLRPTGTENQVDAALKSITLEEDRRYDDFEDPTDDFSGAHFHLDANGEQTGPARSMDGGMHDHEKAGGGRVGAAPGTKGHVHPDENNTQTGPDMPIFEPDMPDADLDVEEIEMKSSELHTILIDKEIYATMDEAIIQADKFGQIIQIDETPTEFKFSQRDSADFIEDSFRSFKPKDGVTLVFGELRA